MAGPPLGDLAIRHLKTKRVIRGIAGVQVGNLD